MEPSILSCIPIAVLIIGILITNRMTEMLILGGVLGTVMVYGSGFFGAYIGKMYTVMADPSFDFLMIIVFGFGAFIKLLEQSGGLLGFSGVLKRLATNDKKSLVTTWFLGAIVFVDDYLNALAVSASMKGITDGYKVPREHLAYTVNTMGACVCVMIPFTSWAAFAVATISAEGLTFADYVHSIPLMFYPIFAILICLLVAVGAFPKVGSLKKAYGRVAETGDVLCKIEGTAIVKEKTDTGIKPSSPWNFFVPIIVLIVVMLICDNDLVHGLLAALLCQAILYIAQRRMTLTEFMNNMLEGISSMASLALVGLLIFVFVNCNNDLQFTEYVIGVCTAHVPPVILAPLAFLLCAGIAFTAGTFWPLIVIAAPIFIPLAQSMDVAPTLAVAAIMSGVALGSHACFYSDAIIMTAAGTGVPNQTQVKVAIPYVAIAAALATICFFIAGMIF